MHSSSSDTHALRRIMRASDVEMAEFLKHALLVLTTDELMEYEDYTAIINGEKTCVDLSLASEFILTYKVGKTRVVRSNFAGSIFISLKEEYPEALKYYLIRLIEEGRAELREMISVYTRTQLSDDGNVDEVEKIRRAGVNPYADITNLEKYIKSYVPNDRLLIECAMTGNDGVFKYIFDKTLCIGNTIQYSNVLKQRYRILHIYNVIYLNDPTIWHEILIRNLNNPVTNSLLKWLVLNITGLFTFDLSKVQEPVIRGERMFHALLGMAIKQRDTCSLSDMQFFKESVIYHGLSGNLRGRILEKLNQLPIQEIPDAKFKGFYYLLTNGAFKTNFIKTFTRCGLFTDAPLCSLAGIKYNMKYSSDMVERSAMLQHPCSVVKMLQVSKVLNIVSPYLGLKHENRFLRDNFDRLYSKHIERDSLEEEWYGEYLSDLFSVIHNFWHRYFPKLNQDVFLEFAQLVESDCNDALYTSSEFKVKFTSILGNKCHATHNYLQDDHFIKKILLKTLKDTKEALIGL